MRLRVKGGLMRRKVDWRVRSALAVAGQLALAGCEKGTAPSQAAEVTAPTTQVAAQANPGHGALKTQPGEVPLGAVIDWWRPDPTFPVPDGFLIADGSRVADPKSPLDGMALPDLRAKFVRGARDVADIGASGGASEHVHTVTPQASYTSYESHHHEWSHLDVNPDGKRVWVSYDPQAQPVLMTIWSNGIGDEGAGNFPIATGGTAESFHTNSAVHRHEVVIPAFTTAPAANDPSYVGLLKIVRVR